MGSLKMLPDFGVDIYKLENTLGLVLVSLIGLYVAKRWYEQSQYAKEIDKLPGPLGFPFFGNMPEFGFCNSSMSHNINPNTVFLDLRPGLCKFYEKFGFFRLWTFGKPVIILFQAHALEPLLTSNVSINKSKFYRFIEPWLGKGLLTREGEMWKNRRKVLTPTFHFKILQDFLPVMNHHSRTLIEKLGESVKEPWVDIVSLLTNCTLDMISETAMGLQLNFQNNSSQEYAKAVHDATMTIAHRATKPWLWLDIVYNKTKNGKRFKECIQTINELTLKVIKMKKEEQPSQEQTKPEADKDALFPVKKRLAFLDLLLERHLIDPKFTEKDMIDEVNTFMFAGHDTTSTALTYILYLLGLYPDIQEKVYDEIFQVLGNSESDVTLDDMRELKYTDMVIKECQRLYPPVPGFARVAEEDLKIGDQIIPNGTSIFVLTFVLHRDPKVFPNPEVFDPERFSLENCSGRSPYAYIPFSAGPRNCIGQKYAQMETKVVLSHILRNFKIISLDQRDKLQLAPEVVLRSNNPIKIKFQSRNH